MSNLIKEILMAKTIDVVCESRINNLVTNAKLGVLKTEHTGEYLLVKTGNNTKASPETVFRIPLDKVSEQDLELLR